MQEPPVADSVDVPPEDVGRRTARSGVGLVLRTVAGQLVALLALLLLSASLEPAEYALYALVVLTVTTATSALTLPTIVLLVRTVSTPSRSVVDAATTFCASVLGAAGVLGTAMLAWFGSDLVALGVAGTVYAVCTASTIPSTVALQRALRAARASLVSLAIQVAMQGVTAFAVLAGAGLEDALVIALLASAVAAVVSAQLLSRQPVGYGSFAQFRPLFVAAVGAFVIGIVNLLVLAGITSLTAALSTPTQAGYFAWSLTIAIAAQGLTALLDTAIVPALARSEGPARASRFVLATRVVTAFAIIVSLAAVLVVPALVGVVFPERWEVAVDALFVLGVANMFAGFALPAYSFWYVEYGTVPLARRYVAAFAVAIVVMVLLVPSTGAVGGAVGFLTYQATLALVLHARLVRVGIRAVAPLAWIAVAATGIAVARASAGLDATTYVYAAVATFSGVVSICVAFDRGRIAREVVRLARGLA